MERQERTSTARANVDVVWGGRREERIREVACQMKAERASFVVV